MTTASSAPSSETGRVQSTPPEAAPGSSGEGKPTISPAERWLKIREKACLRVQKRAFVGGDPFRDWKEAEKAVDAMYVQILMGPHR
ncbi:MAG: hypothetical protein LJE70_08685 [Chromatiaceae bacterium]|nr:hypothetical protein [Chromatiaceae bacterium]